MGPLGMMALMGGMGLAKDVLVDQPKAARDRKLQAAIAQYSPWTGMAPQTQGLSGTDTLGTAMQGGMAGAQLGQAMEAQQAYNNYMQQMADQQQIGKAMAKPGQMMMSTQPMRSPYTMMS
jgi:hypothetical protein